MKKMRALCLVSLAVVASVFSFNVQSQSYDPLKGIIVVMECNIGGKVTYGNLCTRGPGACVSNNCLTQPQQ
jgi:hypothetical protein